MLNADDRLYFIHIPKAAGTTLIPLLDARFDEREICPAQLWRELLKLPQEDLPNYRLFRGHFGGYGLNSFLPKPPVAITFLRHPVALAMSSYKFVLREPGARLYPLVRARQMSFADFIRRAPAANKLTRSLSTQLNYTNSRGPVLSPRATLSEVDRWIRVHRVHRSLDERLELAKERLRGCAFFGIVERFDDSMAVLSHTFGWPPIKSIQKLREAPKDSGPAEVPPHLAEEIIENNELDVELYHFAAQLFDERFSQMTRDLEALMTPEERHLPTPAENRTLLTNLLDRHYERCRALLNRQPGERIHVDFSQRLDGSGWHRREDAPRDGSIFRWTGPGTVSTLDLDLRRDCDLRITIRVLIAIDSDILDSLQVRVNEHPIDLTVLAGVDSVARVYQGVIPRSALDSSRCFTRLSFHVARTVPVETRRSPDADHRKVGVAVNWIDLRPASELAAGKLPKPQYRPEDLPERRRRKRAALVRELKHQVARIPMVGPRLRNLYLHYKSR